MRGERANGMGGQGTIGCICFGGSVTRLLAEYERAAEKGDVSYETVLTGLWVEGTRIVGVRTLSNGQTRDISARIVIDATGNATVPRMLGLPLRKGRDFDGVMAPCSRGETWLNAKGVQHPIYRNYPIDLTGTARAYSGTISFFAGERHKFWKGQRKMERLRRVSF